jgi:phosphoribosylformylglycinamidine synthase subunit PurL
MAMAAGIGARLEPPPSQVPAHAFWFGEDQARYLITVRNSKTDAIAARAAVAKVPVWRVGSTHGTALTVPNERPIVVAALSERFEAWLPAYMADRVA